MSGPQGATGRRGAARPSGRSCRREALDPARLVRRRPRRELRPRAAAVPERGRRLRLGRDPDPRLLGHHLAALDQRRVLGEPPVRLHVPVAVGVEDAEVDRVHPHRLGHLVHVRLDGEVDPGDAEAAHGGGGRAVGVDAVDVGVDVRDRVGAGQVPHALDDRVGRQPRVGAAVEVAGELAGDDPPVPHHAVLDVPALGAAGGADLHLLLPVPGVLDRPPGQHRAEDGEGFVDRVDLAAEAAAHRAADEVEPRGRRLQHLRRRAEREEQRLRGGVADVAPVLFGRRDGAAGLDRGLLDGRHLVAALDDVVGLAEGRLHVAVAELLVVVLAVVDELVRRVDVEDGRRAGLHRLLHVEDMGERLPLDPHRLHGGARLRLGLGDHRRHRLALVAHAVGRTGSARRRCRSRAATGAC
jgi:hypothetical protein